MAGEGVAAALADASRDGGAVLASLVRQCGGNLELAEDALQDAYEVALHDWASSGVPREPVAWLRTTARRKAIDRIRREATGRDKQELLARLESTEPPAPAGFTGSALHDDQLRLVFCCAHPALSVDSQIALTLRAVGGLQTTDIAASFLVPEPTMAQRIVRAKKKVSRAGIPFRMPADDELADRLATVLGVLYLIFTAGHHSRSDGALVRTDLCEEAIRLTRQLAELLAEEDEVAGLLALMLLQHSRRSARIDSDGRPVPLDEQDRELWDLPMMLEGTRMVTAAVRRGQPGSYQLQAAIAAVHGSARDAGDTDWDRILALYDEVLRRTPSAMVELNRTVAVTMANGPESGSAALCELRERRPELETLHLTHTTDAEILRRLGREGDAAESLRRALELAPNPAERTYIELRLAGLSTR
ncbi:MAG: RNA polymerase sigma factor [Microthrixaceae bacterium]